MTAIPALLVCCLCAAVALLLPCAWAARSSISYKSVTVLENSTAVLPCDVTAPDLHDDVILVLWFREDLGTPIFSADARDVPVTEALVWYDNEVLNGRAQFLAHLQPAVLTLSNVSIADQSLYRCRVDFRDAKSRNAHVNLTVIEPPRSVVIRSEIGQRLTNMAGPYRLGDRPKLTCHVTGGIPTPTVIWRRNHEIMEASTSIESPTTNDAGALTGSVIKSTLLLTGLRRTDLHSVFTCQASNSNLSKPLEAKVAIELEVPPLSVSIQMGDRLPTADRATQIACKIIGSRPPPHVSWWRDGSPLPPSSAEQTTSADGNLSVSLLNVTLHKEDLGGQLTCRAVNPHLTSVALEDTWTIDLAYLPIVSLAMGRSLRADIIKAGDDVYFDCYVDARPPATRVEWRRSGQRLNHNVTAGIILTNQSLVLQNVGRHSAGNISCAASNIEGISASEIFVLDVKYPPMCKPGLNRYYGVARAEPVEISCQVESNPSTDLHFRWFFNNSAETIDVPRSRFITRGTSSILTYTPMTSLDFGTLLCYASNSAGTQVEPCIFHILPAGPPEPVFNCTVFNQSAETVMITCQPGFHGGLPQNFLLELIDDVTSTPIDHQTMPEPTFFLGKLKSNSRYKAIVTAVNAKGKSEEVAVEISTMREPERQLEVKPEPTEARSNAPVLTPTLAIMIGALTLLCVAGFLLGLLLRRQCRQDDSSGPSTSLINFRTGPRPQLLSTGTTRFTNPKNSSSSTSGLPQRDTSLPSNLTDNASDPSITDLTLYQCADPGTRSVSNFQSPQLNAIMMAAGSTSPLIPPEGFKNPELRQGWPVGEPPPHIISHTNSLPTRHSAHKNLDQGNTPSVFHPQHQHPPFPHLHQPQPPPQTQHPQPQSPGQPSRLPAGSSWTVYRTAVMGELNSDRNPNPDLIPPPRLSEEERTLQSVSQNVWNECYYPMGSLSRQQLKKSCLPSGTSTGSDDKRCVSWSEPLSVPLTPPSHDVIGLEPFETSDADHVMLVSCVNKRESVV